MKHRSTLIGGLVLVAAAWTTPALAHCDTLDGPVVSAARTALDTGNVDLVLVWVQKEDEGDVRSAFQRARSVRRAGGEATDLADTSFFDTLVRVHRAGEGAPYAGLKPGGQTELPVAAADRAIATAELQPLARLVAGRVEQGLHDHFEAVKAKKGYDPADVEAGRAFTRAYVAFVHHVERLHDAAGTTAADHARQPGPAHVH